MVYDDITGHVWRDSLHRFTVENIMLARMQRHSYRVIDLLTKFTSPL